MPIDKLYIRSAAPGTKKYPNAIPVYYDSSTDLLKFYDDDGSTQRSLVTSDQSQTLTNKVLTAATITTGLTPTSSDGAALGSGSLMFSDLFLASGGVINFNNGDATLTHASNLVTFAGGTLSVGTFASAIAGSGIAIGTLTKAFDVCADDGVAALTAGNYQATRSRFLIASAIASGDISVQGLLGQTKIVANVASSGYVSGVRGYVEAASASLSSAAGVRGMIDVPSGSTIASGAIAAAFQADSNDLGGTHTGKASAIHVPNPVAGTWDYALVLGTATGCHTAGAGTYSTADGYIKIRVGADDMRIPYFAGTD